MANVILRVKKEDGSWAEIPALVGPEGPQGVSIDDIVLKSQEGDVSTYSILLSDGSEKTFQVTDGASITDVALISTDVLIDTYKISISDGSFFNFKVTNGRGIKSIAKTSTDVLSDTYTISYNDNTSSTFKVANGKGITKIVKSKTDDLTDTYTISYNDNTTSTYTITNGRGIKSIAKTSTDVLTDTYTISYNDNTTSTYIITNGKGITKIDKSNTDVLSDTYTISYNDNTTSTYTITNGKGITKIDKSNTDILTDTYTISYNDNTTSTYTVTNGRGIDYIEKDETIGLSDKYTIHYNDGSTSYYYVTNGEDGPAGGIGNRIYLTGLVDKVDDEEGYGRVKELKESKFDLSKFTVVGSPLISEDGIASGFDNSNYLTTIDVKELKDKSWTIKTNFINNNVTTTTQNTLFNLGGWMAWGSISVNSSSTNTTIVFCSRTGTVDDTNNERAWASKTLNYPIEKIEASMSFDINTGTYTAKADWGEGEQIIGTYIPTTENKQLYYINISETENLRLQIGTGSDGTYLKKATDLKKFSVTVDGKEVFNGNKTWLDVIKPDNYTVVGSPVISDDGVASGFINSGAYITSDLSLNSTSKLVVKSRAVFDNSNPEAQVIFRLYNPATCRITAKQDGFNMWCNDTFSSLGKTLNNGDIIDIEAIYETNKQTYYITVNGVTTQVNGAITCSLADLNSTRVIFGRYDEKDVNNYFAGSIDLNSFKIYVNGNLVYQPCLKIPYTQSKTGSKIVDVAYRDRVEDCYNQYGAGNYYLFSNATEQFALPMPDLYGLIENLKLNITAIEGADW